MIPDLGQYASEVLVAYGATFFLLAAISGYSFWTSERTRKRLADFKNRQMHE